MASEKRHRCWLSFLLIFVVLMDVYSQNNDYVDATIQLYPTTAATPEIVSKFITRDFKTEEDKVRAIYSWLIQNVVYDPAEYKNFDYRINNYRERNKKEEKNRKKIINHTLQTGKAVCEGYAMVFEKLCQLQGIDTYLVRGDTKTNFKDIGRPFTNNHMWNVAFIDGKPYLFDATWGAGRYNGTFIKEPTFFYFKVSPKKLINTHYPAQFDDAFLTQKITKETFSNRPIVIGGFLEIDDILKPELGVIYEKNIKNDVIEIVLATAVKDIRYRYDSEIKKLPEMTQKTVDNQTTFTIPFEKGMKKVLIYFDNKPALGYKIE